MSAEVCEEQTNLSPSPTEISEPPIASEGGIELTVRSPGVLAFNPFPVSLTDAIQVTSDKSEVPAAQESGEPFTLASIRSAAPNVFATPLSREETGDVEQAPTQRSRHSVSKESKCLGDEVATTVDPVVYDSSVSGATQRSAVANTATSAATTNDRAIPVHGWTASLEQVLRNVSADLLNPSGILINLHLPELGALKIGALLKNGVLTARLDAQSPATLRALREKLSELEAALARQGYPVDLQVHRLDEHGSQQSGFDGQSSGESPQEPPAEPGTEPVRRVLDSPKTPPVPVPRRNTNHGQLDIHI